MSKCFDPADLDLYPTSSGVYQMLDETGQVLYVGKAKNLKNRLKSYYSASGDTRVQVPFLLAKTCQIETILVDSEKEALLLENTLIKKHQPKYNVLLKDDKGYICLKVTTKHPWPKIELVRFKGPARRDGEYFGPYTSAFQARQLYDLLGKLFPLRQCSDEEFSRRKTPCMLYQIKRCSAPCVGYVSQEEYTGYVRQAVQVIKGQNDELLEALTSQIANASQALEFERAQALLEKKKLIESLGAKQSVDVMSTEDMDAWGIYREGSDIVICKLLIRSGKLVGAHHFDFDGLVQHTDELLSSFLMQHYTAQNQMPNEILLDEKLEDSTALSQLFSEKTGRKVLFKMPERGDKKKLADLAHTNAKAFFGQRKDKKAMRERALLELQEKLMLTRYPQRIDCFDNSHLAGGEPVSAAVCYVDGQKHTSGYRKYKIRDAKPGDDYAMMRESLERHLGHAKEQTALADLIVIDGGKGHLKEAMQALARLQIVSCDVIALAKEEGRHDKGATLERVFVPGRAEPITLERHSPALFLLQNIRDEAHRYVLEFQKVRRTKSTIKSSLDSIEGIGSKKKKKLLSFFSSVKSISQKSVEELMQVPGIGRKDAMRIVQFFNNSRQ